MVQRIIAAVAVTVLVTVPAASAALQTVTIVSAGGSHSFTVEVMQTEEERERGLMFRKSLPADRGMLFDFKTAAPVMMWMKNTFIPLDMIFIAPDGKVLSTQEHAEPMSERVIHSGGAALGVLEVNAGTVARDGIRAGDTVRSTLSTR